MNDQMPAFEMIAIVDWSAAATAGPVKPAPDRCWLAWQRPGIKPAAEYFRTRQDCQKRIVALIRDCKGPAFFGFDFPLGYPAGSGLGGGRKLAARLDQLISDPTGTANNRFDVASDLNARLSDAPGPFWGCPRSQSFSHLHPKKPDFSGLPFGEYRTVEALLRRRKKQIMTLWQLYGAGAVGSQTLTGLPVLNRISRDVAPRPVRYWPFETRWDEKLEDVILGEIWPSLTEFEHIDHDIKDARQVTALRDSLWRKNIDGTLIDDFKKPDALSPAQTRKIHEEGWILGVR